MPNTIFFPPKNKTSAKRISIVSPAEFWESVEKLKQGGLTLQESRALRLAQNRAKAQLKRKDLSLEERHEFKEIAQVKLPK